MKLGKITRAVVYIGCDPEFFFRKKGKIIGAEKVLGEKPKKGALIKCDGVQVEINPPAHTCRQAGGKRIKEILTAMNVKLRGTGVVASLDRAVRVSKNELNSLSFASRILGCKPSLKAFLGLSKTNELKVNPHTYTIRSGGGHIHLGRYNSDTYPEYRCTKIALKPKNHIRTVTMLDIVCGNTSVLLDRDPENIRRRRVYGRAGEYRKTSYGLEYRVLSNYWLQHPTLHSFAFGMARLAVCIVGSSTKENDYEKAILDRVDIKKVVKAINTNDFDLALENYNAIKDILAEITENDGFYSITPANKDKFVKFVKDVEKNGIDKYFGGHFVDNWLSEANNPFRGEVGFNGFLNSKI